jgi:hypothetical protein
MNAGETVELWRCSALVTRAVGGHRACGARRIFGVTPSWLRDEAKIGSRFVSSLPRSTHLFVVRGSDPRGRHEGRCHDDHREGVAGGG